MDELNCLFNDKLKVSALNKSKTISKYVRSVTIGPNADPNDRTNLNITIFNKDNDSRDVAKQQRRNNYTEDVVSKRIFVEAENLRRNEVVSAIEKRIRLYKEQERLANQKRLNTELQIRQRNLDRIDQEENLLRQKLQTIELQAKAESARLLEYQKVTAQKRSAAKQGIRDEHNEKEKLKLLEELLVLQSQYRDNYAKILTTCEQNNLMNEVFKNHSNDVRDWTQAMEKIISRCSNRNVDSSSLQEANQLVNNIKDLYAVIIKEIGEALQEKNSVQPPSNVSNNVPVSEPAVVQSPPIEQVEHRPTANDETETTRQINEVLSQYVSSKCFENYRELSQFLKAYEASYQNLLHDEKFKKYRFDCQKAINMPINAITAVSGQHLTDKYNRIVKFLIGREVEVGTSQVSITKHPEALPYCTDLLAKKFVRQGDLMVSSNPKSAFAFAAVIVALWVKFPDFGKLLLANFYRECIYLIPMYLPQAEGQTNQDYYKALNYRYTDDEVEEQDKFLKRMAGIIRLYSAIIITKQRKSNVNLPHPHGINYGWVLLTNVLNLTPRIDITATAIHNILDVIGNELFTTYGRQFTKLIKYIARDFIPRMEQIDSGGPVVRLQVFLNEIQKRGTISKPDGMLPNDFW